MELLIAVLLFTTDVAPEVHMCDELLVELNRAVDQDYLTSDEAWDMYRRCYQINFN